MAFFAFSFSNFSIVITSLFISSEKSNSIMPKVLILYYLKVEDLQNRPKQPPSTHSVGKQKGTITLMYSTTVPITILLILLYHQCQYFLSITSGAPRHFSPISPSWLDRIILSCPLTIACFVRQNATEVHPVAFS